MSTKEYKAKKDGQDFTVRAQPHDVQRFDAQGGALPVRTLYVVYQGEARVTHSDSIDGLLKAGYEIEAPTPEPTPEPKAAVPAPEPDAPVDAEVEEPAPAA